MDEPSKQDHPRETFQPLNSMFNNIVLPPTNFESVYDQRDNDEVLSDIRQVKSELENSVLQSPMAAAETFERAAQSSVVMIFSEADNAELNKTSDDLDTTTQILDNSSVVADEVQPVVENAVDCVVRNEDNGAETVTTKVNDRTSGENAEMGILPVADPHPLDEFCKKNLAPVKRLTLLASQSSPQKNLVSVPKLDVRIKDAIKHKSRSSTEVQKQAAISLLNMDEILRTLQFEFRALSAPVLDCALMIQDGKTADLEHRVGDILCQLVMLNEQVVAMRRNRILEHFNQDSELVENLDLPKGEEDLFGSHFGVDALFEASKAKRKGADVTAISILKTKRTRRAHNFAEPKKFEDLVPEVEAEIGKHQDSVLQQDENNVGELWNTEAEKPQRLKRTSVRADAKKVSAKKKTERVKRLRKEKRDKEKADREAEAAQMLADINVGRKTRQSSKVDISKVVQSTSEAVEDDDEKDFDDDRDADYRAELDVDEEAEDDDEEDEEDDVALDEPRGVTQKYACQNRRGDGSNKESDSNCEHCDYIADKRRKLIHHVKTYHPDKLIPCDLCDRKFAFQVSLWNHKNAMHLGAEFKCPQCTRSFKDADKLRTHMFVHSSLKPFVCDICGKGCLTKVHLDSHVKVHERRNNLYCQTCDRYFGSNHTFRNHMKLHSGEKEWFCDICNAGFPIKPRLVLHKKIAHSDEQYVCDECGKGFKMKHILNDHKALLHSSKKSFVCEICGVGFKLRSVLKRHMKTHSDERPHKCDLCDKAFKVKSTLVEHRKTHTNEKPYLCDQCGMAFKRNAERRKHNCVNKADELSAEQVAVAEISDAVVDQQQQQQQQQVEQSQQLQMPSHLHLQSPPPLAVHAQPIAVTTGHIVTHMPIQIAPQMIQLMPHSATLVTAGPQLMQVHDEQLQAVASAQFTNFSVG